MFKIEAKLESHKKLQTKTNIVFSTKDDIDELDLLQLSKNKGYLLFHSSDFKKQVEEVMINRKFSIDEKGKSKSQILRGVLFRLWGQGDIPVEDSEGAYNHMMDIVINHFKSKLKD